MSDGVVPSVTLDREITSAEEVVLQPKKAGKAKPSSRKPPTEPKAEKATTDPEASDQIRSRCWTFTLNNYTDAHIEFLNTMECQYIIYGKEVAPTTGTPHLQGYVSFHNARYFKSLKKLVPWWIAPSKGDALSNSDYCTKESKDVYERGKKPMSHKEKGMKEKDKWAHTRKCATEGRFDEIPDDLYVRYYTTLKRMHQQEKSFDVSRLTSMENYWYSGPPNTGKSFTAQELYPQHYLKTKGKWWDGYAGEETVIIEEWSPYDREYTQLLKIWSDIYPFNAEVKNGMIKIRPKRFIITSNYSLEECFGGVDCDSIRSRFQLVKFTNAIPPSLSLRVASTMPHSKDEHVESVKRVKLITDTYSLTV